MMMTSDDKVSECAGGKTSCETHPKDHYGEVEQVFACASIVSGQHTTHKCASLHTKL